MSEWREVRLGDAVSIAHGWPFVGELCSEELSGKPIIVSIGNFRYTGGFRFEETMVREYRGSSASGGSWVTVIAPCVADASSPPVHGRVLLNRNW